MVASCNKSFLQLAIVSGAAAVLCAVTQASSADTPPVELLRDPTASKGFVFSTPEAVGFYRKTGYEVTNNGISSILANPDASDPYKSLTSADDGRSFIGANRLGRSTDNPIWGVYGYGGSTTLYSRAHDYVSGQPAGGDAGCPSGGVSAPCTWDAKSTAASGSKTIASLTAGRGLAGSAADMIYRLNEKDSFLTYNADNYWGQCISVPSGVTPANDSRCLSIIDGSPLYYLGALPQTTVQATVSPSGNPLYFNSTGRGQLMNTITQTLVGDRNLANISTLVLSGDIKLSRSARIDYSSSGVTTCTPEEILALRWNGSQSQYVNCYSRLVMTEDLYKTILYGSDGHETTTGPVVDRRNATPWDMSIFDMGFQIINKKGVVQGTSVYWIGVISSIDWVPDLIETDTGKFYSGGWSAVALTGQDLFDPASWSLAASADPLSTSYTKLPSFVFYNTPFTNTKAAPNTYPSRQASNYYQPPVRLNPGTWHEGTSVGMGVGESTWNTSNTMNSGWVSFSTQYTTTGSPAKNVNLITWIQAFLDQLHAADASISNNLGDYELGYFGYSFETSAPVDEEVQFKNLSLKATYKTDSTIANTSSAINGLIQ